MVASEGTGMSTVLQWMVLENLERGNGLAALDPQGGISTIAFKSIPQGHPGQVICGKTLDSDGPLFRQMTRPGQWLRGMGLGPDVCVVRAHGRKRGLQAWLHQ